jgi:hypothetical protein
MKTYFLLPLVALSGLSACGDSGDTAPVGTAGSAGAGSGGASSGGSSSKSSGGASSGGTSSTTGGAATGGTGPGTGGTGPGTGGTAGLSGEFVTTACATADGMNCVLYRGPESVVPALTESCTMQGGTPSGACPPGATGACTSTIVGGQEITQVHYLTDAQALMQLETSCTDNGGTWSVP